MNQKTFSLSFHTSDNLSVKIDAWVTTTQPMNPSSFYVVLYAAP
jgi:hypothetical protein